MLRRETKGIFERREKMHLIEAHKSGRWFKRPSWSVYMKLVQTDVGVRFQSKDGCADDFTEIDDFETTDYILEPEAKMLTREEVEGAFQEAYDKYPTSCAAHRKGMLDILFG